MKNTAFAGGQKDEIMATVIMTDSTSDITAEHIKELGIYVLPVIVNFGEKVTVIQWISIQDSFLTCSGKAR